MGVVSACAWEEDAWVWSVCAGCVGVVSACAWEEDAWVWSVHVHGRRTRGCGQCVRMGGRVGARVVSVCAWEGHC